MSELFYKKEYIANDLGSLILKNPEPALSYIEDTVKSLLATKDDHVAQRTIKCKLFKRYDSDIV